MVSARGGILALQRVQMEPFPTAASHSLQGEGNREKTEQGKVHFLTQDH